MFMGCLWYRESKLNMINDKSNSVIKKQSIKKNFVMNIILKMSSFIFPLITTPYVSRVLQPVGTGKVSFATSVISYFSMFAQLGIPTYGIRACAEVRDNKEELTRTAQELLIINLVMCVFSYVALAIALIFVPRFRKDRTLYIIMSATIFLTSLGMEWLYQALEQYTYIAIRSIIFKVIALVAMFLLIHQKSDYVIYGAISIFAASASNIFNFIYARHFISLKPVGHYNFKHHMKAVGIFFAMSCATTIYTQMDTTMIGFIKTDIDVGYYNVATKIKTVLVSVVTALGTVLLPRASYYVAHNDMGDFKRITTKAITFVLDISIPLMLYFILFAKETVYLLSGPSYTGAIVPMQIIMPTIVLIGLTNIMGIQVLVPLGQEKKVLYSEIIGAIVNLIINSLLISRFASSGAAIGTVFAELAVWIVQYYVLADKFNVIYKNISYWKIILACAVSVFASLWVKLLNFGNFVTLIISALLFFGVCCIVLIATKEEIMTDVIIPTLKKKMNKAI